MQTARTALRGLPDAAVASLCDAFADEVSERLPRVLQAARTRDPDLLELALRDVHTLGSSAFVLGENEAGRVARAVEALLLAGTDLTPLDALVATLEGELAGWRR